MEKVQEQAIKESVKFALDLIRLITDTIKDAKRIPSGAVYAVMMDKIDIHQYNKIINILVDAGLIEVKNHELIWIMKDEVQ